AGDRHIYLLIQQAFPECLPCLRPRASPAARSWGLLQEGWPEQESLDNTSDGDQQGDQRQDRGWLWGTSGQHGDKASVLRDVQPVTFQRIHAPSPGTSKHKGLRPGKSCRGWRRLRKPIRWTREEPGDEAGGATGLAFHLKVESTFFQKRAPGVQLAQYQPPAHQPRRRLWVCNKTTDESFKGSFPGLDHSTSSTFCRAHFFVL
ncbi:hypothetical protein H1C71_026998, partial [Ictidomys tridecemlineatus]